MPCLANGSASIQTQACLTQDSCSFHCVPSLHLKLGTYILKNKIKVGIINSIFADRKTTQKVEVVSNKLKTDWLQTPAGWPVRGIVVLCRMPKLGDSP